MNGALQRTLSQLPIINVSCSERGRRSYRRRHFEEPDVVMERKVRSAKRRSVSASLKQAAAFYSDQRDVWDRIDAPYESAGVRRHLCQRRLLRHSA